LHKASGTDGFNCVFETDFRRKKKTSEQQGSVVSRQRERRHAELGESSPAAAKESRANHTFSIGSVIMAKERREGWKKERRIDKSQESPFL